MTDNTMDDSDWTMAKRIRNAIWRLKYLEQKYVEVGYQGVGRKNIKNRFICHCVY